MGEVESLNTQNVLNVIHKGVYLVPCNFYTRANLSDLQIEWLTNKQYSM